MLFVHWQLEIHTEGERKYKDTGEVVHFWFKRLKRYEQFLSLDGDPSLSKAATKCNFEIFVCKLDIR